MQNDLRPYAFLILGLFVGGIIYVAKQEPMSLDKYKDPIEITVKEKAPEVPPGQADEEEGDYLDKEDELSCTPPTTNDLRLP